VVKDKKVEDDLQEIKKRLDEIKKRSAELSIVLPLESGKSIQRNFNKIIKKLDEMLEK